MTTEARKRLKKMSVPERLAAFREQAAKQEKAAVEMLRLVAAALQPIELDGLENLVARAESHGAITAGRAAGIRNVIRGRRRRLARATEVTHLWLRYWKRFGQGDVYVQFKGLLRVVRRLRRQRDEARSRCETLAMTLERLEASKGDCDASSK